MFIHNKLRAEVQRRFNVTNMLELQHVPHLEHTAYRLANCNFSILNNPAIVGMVHEEQLTWSTVLQSIIDKTKPEFQYGVNIGSTYNYTNIIWATSSKVGCARRRCTKTDINLFFYICVYFPILTNFGSEFIAKYPYEVGTLNAECQKRTDKTWGLCNNPCDNEDRHSECDKQKSCVSDNRACWATCKCPSDTIYYINHHYDEMIINNIVDSLIVIRKVIAIKHSINAMTRIVSVLVLGLYTPSKSALFYLVF